MEKEMKELYTEGLATHGDPEPCGGVRKGAVEALVGARAGGAIEPRNNQSGAPTSWKQAEGNIAGGVIASRQWALRGRRTQARTESPCARTGRARRCPSPDQRRVAR